MNTTNDKPLGGGPFGAQVADVETVEPKVVVNGTPIDRQNGDAGCGCKPSHVGIAEMLHGVGIATEGFRHMEKIGQHRLHNFLVGDTILLLGWATLYEIGHRQATSEHSPDRAILLLIFAFLSALFSFLWMILGMRERKFLDLQMNIVLNLETILEKVSGKPELKITHPVRTLQNGTPELADSLKGVLKLNKLNRAEHAMKSRNLAVWAPCAFGVASLLLMFFSVNCF